MFEEDILNDDMFSDDEMPPSSQIGLQADKSQEFDFALEFNSSSDEDLISTCESVENHLISRNEQESSAGSSTRFADPKPDDELAKLGQKFIPERSRKSMQWARNVFETWRKFRNGRIVKGDTSGQRLSLISRSLEELNDDELNYSLCRFVCEARKENGDEYLPATLRQLVLLLQMHLNNTGRHLALLSDTVFQELQNTLDSVMRVGASKGQGIRTRQAKVISLDQEGILWKKGILGSSSPQVLLDTLLYLVGLALRSGDEHRNLTTDQLELGENEHGEYLKYTENISKCKQRGLNDFKIPAKTVVAFAGENTERCIVALYRKYLDCRPSNASSSMYLRPLTKPCGGIWYSISPVGKHTLAGTIGKLCKTAGFDGFYSNHSLRATCATRLFQSGVDEQLIARTTGH